MCFRDAGTGILLVGRCHLQLSEIPKVCNAV